MGLVILLEKFREMCGTFYGKFYGKCLVNNGKFTKCWKILGKCMVNFMV